MSYTNSTAEDLAYGRWHGILHALGVDQSFLTGKHGPCPMCGGKDRWRFTDHKGEGRWICNHCGSGNGFDLLKNINGWSFREAATEIERLLGERQIPQRKQHKRDLSRLRSTLIQIRKETQPATAVPAVARYLANRGLTAVPDNLYGHPGLPYYDGGHKVATYPAMIGEVTSEGGKLIGVHRTYLTEEGLKAPVKSPKKLLKAQWPGSYSIRLWDQDGPSLCVAEGVETAIAARMRWKCPTWSTIATDGMEKFNPPDGVDKILIAGDNDATFAGQVSAYRLANRLHLQGYAVKVIIPDTVNTDWCDMIQKNISTR